MQIALLVCANDITVANSHLCLPSCSTSYIHGTNATVVITFSAFAKNQMEKFRRNKGLDYRKYTPKLVDVEMVFKIARVKLHYITLE